MSSPVCCGFKRGSGLIQTQSQLHFGDYIVPIFSRVAPSIYVSDLDRAVKFYVEVMGFTLDNIDEPPRRAVVYDGSAVLHIDLQPAKAGVSSTHMIVDGLPALFNRVTAAGTRIIQPPTDQWWGLREMVIADPDGNVFELGEPIRKS